MALPTSLAIVANVAETAGEGISRTLFGVAHLISAAAANVRANKDAAIALSRRVNELVTVITTELERVQVEAPALEQVKAELQSFVAILAEIQSALEEQGKRSYLSQVLHQDRDKDKINALAERTRQAFDVLMLRSELRMDELSRNVAAPFVSSAALRDLQETRLKLSSEATVSKDPVTKLPPAPQQFFGRTSEITAIVDVLGGQSADHVAILGGPGLGKTALALSVAHQPAVVARFGCRRYFIPCDGSEGQPSCLTILGGAFGVGGSSTKTIRKKLTAILSSGPSLIILDNFESAWEASEHRADAEEVLRYLTSVERVSLLITLRGSERPQGVPWSRPFLPPLEALDDTSAIQAFLSISGLDDVDASGRLLLGHLANVPLCVVLVAALAQHESSRVLLERWDQHKTTMLQRDHYSLRAQSFVDVSITLSLESPRMQAVPDASRLLSLLALLPRGIVDTDIRIWGADYSTRALATLLQTSLAFRTEGQRVQVLAPIRAFMLSHHPPTEDLARPLYGYFFGLANALVSSGRSVTRPATVAALAPELENAGFIIRYALEHCGDATPAVAAAVSLCKLYSTTTYGPGPDLAALALDKARRLGLDQLTADLLLWWGSMSYNASVPGDPFEMYNEARGIYERIGNVDGTIDASTNLLPFTNSQAALAEAKGLCELTARRGDPWRSAKCQQKLAEVYSRLGKHADACACHERAIVIMRSVKQEPAADRVVGYSLYQIGACLFDMGDYAQAMSKFHEALPFLQSAENTFGIVLVHYQLGEGLLDQGHWTEAVEQLQLAVATGAADFRFNVTCLSRLARAHLLGGNEAGAFEAIAAAAPLTDSKEAFRYSTLLRAKAELALFRGDTDAAGEFLDAAVLAVRELYGEWGREDVLPCDAATFQIRGKVDVAERRFDDARNCFVIVAIIRRMFPISTVAIPLCMLAEIVDDETASILIDALMLPLQRFGWQLLLGDMLLHSARIARRQGEARTAAHRASRALHHYTQTKSKRGLEGVRSFLSEN
ncbi:hypothetical protein AURDEDRAFT_179946 [Auricularia subglabra TFB-10046 SS5]|nr:hypothetical protein AURDEDRAFT_179946 [Auricularia subglabra TFB-10046 SS5]